MTWIKRNLIFVISAAIAVILLGLAGWYLFQQSSVNGTATTNLEGSYTELTRIGNLQPNPGNDKVNNIEIAKEHQEKVRAVMKQTSGFFTPIPAIPPGTNVTGEAFAASLRRTVDELTRGAASASVTIPPKYDFSFAAQRPLVKFAPGLDALAGELGDVKAICEVLFKARINMLYNIRRPRVSDDDQKGPQSDYLETPATTNELAVIMPYEVTIYGFSGELAAVLAGFASEPHGFIVTTLNVEPGSPGSNTAMDLSAGGMPSESAMMAARMGMMPQPVAPALTAAGKGGLPVMLDEKQLKITLGVNVVKLLPKN